MPATAPAPRKPVEFVGSSEDDLARFPAEVRRVMGFAIFQAELGKKHPAAKPLSGHKEFKGASILEIVDDYDGDTYRAVYTVKLEGVVYVLHAFQKKSKRGSETPKHDIDLIKKRLARAKEHYEENYPKKRKAR
jgi:phage-related protein